MKPGTWNSPPVSVLAGLVTLVAVSPRTLQGHVGRWGQGNRIAVEQNHGNWHTFFEVLPIVVDLFGRQFVLLVARIVHEDERAGLVVEELGFEFFDVSDFEIVSPLEGPVQDGIANQILQFALVQRVALARFDKVDFGQQVGFAVDLYF